MPRPRQQRFALDGGDTGGAGPALTAALQFTVVAAAWLHALLGTGGGPAARVGLALAAALLVAARRSTLAPPRRSRVYLELDGAGLYRVRQGARSALLEWRAAGGITLLGNCTRTELYLAFTTHERTRYVRVDTQASPLATFRWLGARAVAVADLDIGPSGEAEHLSGADAMRLLTACDAQAPGLLGRVYFTNQRGEAVEFSRDRLRVGVHAVDLRAPLEWRAITFHETAGATTTLYQGTYVAQGGREFTFVAPMPGELVMGGDFRAAARKDPDLRPQVMEDLRLLQSTPGDPPAGAERVAMERLFVVPLRRALERAPRLRRGSSKMAAARAKLG
jgi:hypothetical protein